MEYDGICGTILGFVHRKVTLVYKINCGFWMLMVDITVKRGPRCSLPLHVWKMYVITTYYTEMSQKIYQ